MSEMKRREGGKERERKRERERDLDKSVDTGIWSETVRTKTLLCLIISAHAAVFSQPQNSSYCDAVLYKKSDCVIEDKQTSKSVYSKDFSKESKS